MEEHKEIKGNNTTDWWVNPAYRSSKYNKEQNKFIRQKGQEGPKEVDTDQNYIAIDNIGCYDGTDTESLGEAELNRYQSIVGIYPESYAYVRSAEFQQKLIQLKRI